MFSQRKTRISFKYASHCASSSHGVVRQLLMDRNRPFWWIFDGRHSSHQMLGGNVVMIPPSWGNYEKILAFTNQAFEIRFCLKPLFLYFFSNNWYFWDCAHVYPPNGWSQTSFPLKRLQSATHLQQTTAPLKPGYQIGDSLFVGGGAVCGKGGPRIATLLLFILLMPLVNKTSYK